MASLFLEEEVLECCVCGEICGDQDLRPCMLSCGHSCCTSCLQQLPTVSDEIFCATCGVEVYMSQAGVAGLPKNFALLSIFDVKPQQDQVESLFDCEVCDDKHPAIFWCFNCEEDMCKAAAGFHTRSKATRDHQLISLESVTATEFCSKHSEPFRLFDEACGQVVCRRCINLNHKGHKCLSLAEAASKCRPEMQELVTKVNARFEVIKTAEARVKQANLDMKKAYEEQEAQIHSLFREIYAAITARETLLTNELEEQYSSKASILTEQRDRLREFQESVVSTVQSVLSSIQSSGDPELLVARSALEATLRDTENQPMPLEPEVDFVAKLIFDRRTLQNMLDALDKEVIVTENYTCAENTIAEGEGLHYTEPGLGRSFTIIAHDAQKRRRFQGGDLFTVEIIYDHFLDMRVTRLDVEDRGDGIYLVTYTAPNTLKRFYTLNVCLRGVHIHGSPFKVPCSWSIETLNELTTNSRRKYGVRVMRKKSRK